MDASIQPKNEIGTVKYRGPSCGYLSDAKQQYREDIWGVFAERMLDVVLSDKQAYVLLLPSREGLEIDTAIAKGFPAEKIIAIDENPALIASSKWRKKHPDVKFYGCKLSKVGDKLKRDGRFIACANLDLCNNFSDELVSETQSAMLIPRINGWMWAVTVAKGREGKALVHLLKRAGADNKLVDEPRINALIECLGIDDSMLMATIEAQGSYINNRVPMAWAIFSETVYSDVEVKKVSDRHVQLLARACRIDDIRHHWHCAKCGNDHAMRPYSMVNLCCRQSCREMIFKRNDVYPKVLKQLSNHYQKNMGIPDNSLFPGYARHKKHFKFFSGDDTYYASIPFSRRS